MEDRKCLPFQFRGLDLRQEQGEGIEREREIVQKPWGLAFVRRMYLITHVGPSP